MYFYIQDVIVHPDYQKTGVGKAIVQKIMNYLDHNAPVGSFIGLMAAKGKEDFYKRFNSIERPTDKYGSGMFINK